jgi:hypothetical protein
LSRISHNFRSYRYKSYIQKTTHLLTHKHQRVYILALISYDMRRQHSIQTHEQSAIGQIQINYNNQSIPNYTLAIAHIIYASKRVCVSVCVCVLHIHCSAFPTFYQCLTVSYTPCLSLAPLVSAGVNAQNALNYIITMQSTQYACSSGFDGIVLRINYV